MMQLFAAVLGFAGVIYSIFAMSAKDQSPWVSDVQVSHLRSQFDSARTLEPGLVTAKSKWACQLFGVRSRNQIIKNSSFYKFSPFSEKFPAKPVGISNSGKQVVRKYRYQDKQLIGSLGPIIDSVRANSSGQLIAEMSIPRRRSKTSQGSNHRSKSLSSLIDKNREVISYAICK